MSTFNYQAILDTYKKLQDAANAANETRYQDILKTISTTRDTVGGYYDQVGSLIANIGQTDRDRILQNETKNLASTEQDLISRGLGNTTIRVGARKDVQNQAEQQQQALSESLAQQQASNVVNRANFEERIGSLLTNVQQARTDQGPDLNTMAQLLTQLGAGQGAQAAADKKIVNTRVNTASFNAPIQSPSQQLAGGSGGGGGGLGSSTGGFGSGGGGGGGTAAQVIGAGQKAPGSTINIIGNKGSVPTGGSAGSGSTAGMVGGGTTGGGGASGGGAVSGDAFDRLFQGQPVYGDAPGGNMGTYAGQGQIANQSLLDAQGNLQAGRAVADDAGSGGGTTTITISNKNSADRRGGPVETRQIQVPNSLILNGRVRADGKYEAQYLKVMPWGFSQV
ncbi:MAG: hypothetical protein IT442_04940 [Phycisphaeraceae bacterium]|nr:hypothetical protein [Phycisphaeraceae bacterium]